MVDMAREIIKETSEEKALNTAIDNVYKKYGTDLNAFFQDVYNELTLKRQETYDGPPERKYFDSPRR